MKKYYFILTLLLLCGAVNAQIINFPDPVFKAKLLASSPTNVVGVNALNQAVTIDTNGNGEIEVSEAQQITRLYLSNNNINSLEGINYFTELNFLNCWNNNLTSLDISSLIHLGELNCKNNQITFLDLTGQTNLGILDCSYNLIEKIVFGPSLFISMINCSHNMLTSFDLNFQDQGYIDVNVSYNQLANLYIPNRTFPFLTLEASNNQITEVICEPNVLVDQLSLKYNMLQSVNFTQNNRFHQLDLSNNILTSLRLHLVNEFEPYCQLWLHNSVAMLQELDLKGTFAEINFSNDLLQQVDLSQATFYSLHIDSNSLQTLNIKNGQNNTSIEIAAPNLEYVCADESEIQGLLGLPCFSNTSAQVNSYCSFVPGGEFFTIAGDVHYDADGNACDLTDSLYPNVKIGITNGSISGSVIADTSGHYNIPVQAGSHTLTPVFENNYFTSNATTVNFPTDASPAIHDFCIIANGTHPDAEVALIPQGAARPGFDAKYKLLYKNKGTTVQSGNLTLVHENTVAFVNATQNIATQTGNSVSWNFANLQPFEQREIEVTMHVNTPTQTPPVNAGTVLGYIAAINTDLTDETPDDNNFFLHQTVVNSFDPNDKTCLEGQTISAEDIGDYVHYQIRFENTGTADAVNIVVKDVIDTDKFDISSLVPLDGSHDFYTRINGNVVEFIFENINLPFDDANNDGYLVFKIKTKPTLNVGDSFSNSASIYFDYNHPIVTEPAVTTIAVLKTQDFVFADHFKLYPNPARNEVNIQRQSNLEIQSIEIYNALGQLMIAVTNAQSVSKIDVSKLTSGNYFVKVNSEQGSAVARFVKE